jgi:hypothetical protein
LHGLPFDPIVYDVAVWPAGMFCLIGFVSIEEVYCIPPDREDAERLTIVDRAKSIKATRNFRAAGYSRARIYRRQHAAGHVTQSLQLVSTSHAMHIAKVDFH